MMMKKVFLGLFFTISLVLMSCSENHSGIKEWQSDDSHHWHACSIEGCTELFDKAEHSWSEWNEVKPATCKQSGEKVRSCTVCGKEEKEFVSRLMHTDDSYVEKSDDNYHWLECPTCNQVKENSKKEHTFINYVINNDATCSENGTETAKCEGCSKTDTREIANSVLEHVFADYIANNDATCSKNATETAKCATCDETHTREIPNSMTSHSMNLEWEYDEDMHFNKCLNCDYFENAEEHNWGEWTILEHPTFDEEGLKTSLCSICQYDAEVVIPVLVKADLVALNATSKTLHVNEEVNLVATIGPANAENYRVEWLVDNSNVVSLSPNGNECLVASNDALGRATITMKVINELNGEALYVYDVNCIINVVANPIVKYTFDNGLIVNTGSQTDVVAKGTTLEGNSSIVDLEDGKLAFVTGSDGTNNSAIELNNQRDGGNHLSITNIQEITGDFTISVKVYLTKETIKTSYENYLFGTISDDIYGPDWSNGKNNFPGKDPIAPLFNFAYASNDGRMQVRWYINGSSNSLQYIPVGEWVEIRMVKCGTTVTTYIDNINNFAGNPYVDYSKTVELSSPDQLTLSPDFILGLSSNLACQNPGNYPVYYDDIMIYDFATNHMFGEYISNNDATCSKNGTETAKCLDCNVTKTREDLDSKLPHVFTTYISDDNATCSTNCTETAKCDNCDATDTREIANTTLPHTFNVYRDNGDGTETAKCDSCDATDTREIEVTSCEHELNSSYEYNDTYHWHTCLKCEEVVNALEHSWLDATCEAAKTCSICNLTQGEALGHDVVSKHYEVIADKLMLVEVCSRGDEVTSEVDTTKKLAVYGKEDFVLALSFGCDVVLTSDIDLTPAEGEDIVGLVVSSDVVIDLGNYKLSYQVADADSLSATQISVLTINNANVSIINGSIESLGYGLYLKDGSLTLDKLNVSGVTTAVNVYNGTLNILGGHYAVTDDLYNHVYTINCIDASYQAGTAVVNITGGTFEHFNPANNLAEGENTNFVASGYEIMSKDDVYVVLKPAIAKYTFDNGEVVNTGTNQSIIAEAVSNADLSTVDYSKLTFAAGSDGTANSAINLSHKNDGYSFRLRGIDAGTGDFTISVKIYQASTFGTTSAHHYLFGLSVSNIFDEEWNPNGSTAPGKDPVAPLFSVCLKRDSSSAGYMRFRLRFNGEATKHLGGETKDVAGYIKSKTWVEYRVIKSGNTLTISTHFNDVDTVAKTSPASQTYTLSSAETSILTPEKVLGFAYNYGAQLYGNASVYDDIIVYDYAVPFLD